MNRSAISPEAFLLALFAMSFERSAARRRRLWARLDRPERDLANWRKHGISPKRFRAHQAAIGERGPELLVPKTRGAIA